MITRVLRAGVILVWLTATSLAVASADTVRVTNHTVAGKKAAHAPTKRSEKIYVLLDVEYTLGSQAGASLRAGATLKGPTEITTTYKRDVKAGRGTAMIRIEAPNYGRDTLDVLVWLDRKSSDGGPVPEPLKFEKLTFDVSKL